MRITHCYWSFFSSGDDPVIIHNQPSTDPNWVPSQMNTVVAITSNTMADVYGGTGNWDTGSGFAPIATGYSGGALCTKANGYSVFVVAGGGDGDLFYNALPRVDLQSNSPAWSIPFGPSPHCDTVGEDTTHGEWSDGSPGVGHTYGNLTDMLQSMGASVGGSLLMPWATYYHTSNHNTAWGHKCDLNGTTLAAWTRATAGSSASASEVAFALDRKRKRAIGALTAPTSPSSQFYSIDFSDGSGVGLPTLFGTSQFTMGKDSKADVCEDFDLFCMYGTDENGTVGIRTWDMNNGMAKYDLTFTGDTMPSQPGVGFVWSRLNHCWYLRSGAIGDEQKIWKITKNVSGLLTDTWAVVQSTMAGVTVIGNTPNGVFGRFQEAYKEKCLVWATTINAPLYGMRIAA